MSCRVSKVAFLTRGDGEQRAAPQRVAVLLHQLVHQRREFRAVAFPGHLCDDVPARVDQHQRRP